MTLFLLSFVISSVSFWCGVFLERRSSHVVAPWPEPDSAPELRQIVLPEDTLDEIAGLAGRYTLRPSPETHRALWLRLAEIVPEVAAGRWFLRTGNPLEYSVYELPDDEKGND